VTTKGILGLLDVLQQLAEVAVDTAGTVQRVREAEELFRLAVATREDRTAFLIELDRHAGRLTPEGRSKLLVTVHRILRDQLAFGDACEAVLDRGGK